MSACPPIPLKLNIDFIDMKIGEYKKIVCEDLIDLIKKRSSLHSHAQYTKKKFVTRRKELELEVWRTE